MASMNTVDPDFNPLKPHTKGERLGLAAFSMTVGHLVTDTNRRTIVEMIHYMLELERKNDTAARQAGELLKMSRKLNEVYDA